MEFTKMQGAGNDFIIIEAPVSNDFSKLSKKLCQRRIAVGADGLMVVEKKDDKTVYMRYYNSDGSMGEMCGNGARCLAMYAYQHQLVKAKEFLILTLSGEVKAKIIDDVNVEIEMGKPTYESDFENYFLNQEIQIEGHTFTGSYILMGVPHLMIVLDKLDEEVLLKFGPILERHPLFKEGTNINFIEILDRKSVKIDTWERGAGHTLACGTGASASAFLLNKFGQVEESVTLHAPGGNLRVRVSKDEKIYLEGPAVTVFKGDNKEETL